jgi:ketosteroid isomerase-like protein
VAASPEPAGTREAVGGFIAALNSHDPDAIAACVSDDFLNEHVSVRGTTRRGREAYRAALPGFLGSFTNLSYEVEDLVADGDEAAVFYTMRCRFLGGPAGGGTAGGGAAGGGSPAGGIPVTMRGSFYFRVAGGLVAHRRDYFDGEDFARQVSSTPERP